MSSHSEYSQDYFCYKQCHSLNNQAVYDFLGITSEDDQLLYMIVNCLQIPQSP